jgi:UDP-N-acetylmuramate dehydrogenase
MKILKNELLKYHTSLGIGGPCRFFAYPDNEDELSSLLGKPHFIIGRGTNILFPDSGLDTAVVALEKCFNKLKVMNETIYVESGVSLKRLIETAQTFSLSGLEFLSGIPGSVGGAVFMNAGIKAQAILDITTHVHLWSDKGEEIIPVSRIQYGYRKGIRLGLIKGIDLHLKRSKKELIKERINKLMEERLKKQPIEMKTAGCIFKNPPQDFAGRLIELCNLKGERIGEAEISKRHANFIINLGKARYSDVIELIELIKKRVFAKTGIKLELEIEIVNSNT